ncbi:MAG: ATP-binding cassette domain-containing protein [Terricaulis sp.]
MDVLKNIWLSLKDGDRVAIIGRIGSGKSTMLRTMAGIYAPTTGRVWTRGVIAADVFRVRRLCTVRHGLREYFPARHVAGYEQGRNRVQDRSDLRFCGYWGLDVSASLDLFKRHVPARGLRHHQLHASEYFADGRVDRGGAMRSS